jgi:transposase-like protein
VNAPVPVLDRARAAYRQYIEGDLSMADLARLYGVKKSTIRDWIGKARQAEREARRHGGLR